MPKIAVIDSLVSEVVGGTGFGGTTRIAVEDALAFARRGYDTHFVACQGSSPGEHFPGVKFHAIKVLPKPSYERAKLGGRGTAIGAEIAAYCRSNGIDVVVIHGETGIPSALVKAAPELPILFVHHFRPSDNLFFDTGRFRQLMNLHESGVVVAFNTRQNLRSHFDVTSTHIPKCKDNKTLEICEQFRSWVKAPDVRELIVKNLVFYEPQEFVSERVQRHVIASRLAPDKRIHAWAKVARPVSCLFGPLLDMDYVNETSPKIDANPLWTQRSSVPHPNVMRAFQRALSNVATGPQDSFGVTVFEAASFGTPSVIGRAGNHSVVEDVAKEILGVSFPVVDYGGKAFVERAEAALDEAANWTDEQRRDLRDRALHALSEKSMVDDRVRLMRVAIKQKRSRS